MKVILEEGDREELINLMDSWIKVHTSPDKPMFGVAGSMKLFSPRELLAAVKTGTDIGTHYLDNLAEGVATATMKSVRQKTFGAPPPKPKPTEVQPIGDRVVIQRHSVETATAGGILLPDTAKNKPHKGKILAVGPGKTTKEGTHKPLQVKVGDTVLFTSWAGDEYQDRLASDEILVLREDDILAVLES
jgi:chaperonin GroES